MSKYYIIFHIAVWLSYWYMTTFLIAMWLTCQNVTLPYTFLCGHNVRIPVTCPHCDIREPHCDSMRWASKLFCGFGTPMLLWHQLSVFQWGYHDYLYEMWCRFYELLCGVILLLFSMCTHVTATPIISLFAQTMSLPVNLWG